MSLSNCWMLLFFILLSMARRCDSADPPPSAGATSSNCNGGWPPCSLNGQLDKDQGICRCDKLWSGTECEMLQFWPLSIPNGCPNAPSKTAWGGDVMCNAQDKTYHLFVAAMTGGCSLRSWVTHSRIEHAISNASSITGPYEFVGVAVPTWSHNPKVIALQPQKKKTNETFSSSSASLAPFHIGMGVGPANLHENCAKQDCYSSWQRRGHDDASTKATRKLFQDRKKSTSSTLGTAAATKAGGTIHTAPSVYGPWTPLPNNALGNCNNPAPFVVHDRTKALSTIYIVCNHNVLKQAHNIGGPWTTIGEIVPPKTNDHGSTTTHDDAGGGVIRCEDPSLYIDH